MDNKKSPSDDVSKRRRSTIDEADINGYLNTAKEALYKKTIWELLNKDYTSQKHQPQKNQKVPKPNNNKKSNKRVAAASEVFDREVEKEQKKRKLSSKINFDVLEEQACDREEVDETESCGGDDYGGGGDYRDHGFRDETESCGGHDYGGGGDYRDHGFRDETESCGGDDDGGGDYRDHGFQEGDETNEDVDYGDHAYREYEEEEEDGCDDNDEEY